MLTFPPCSVLHLWWPWYWHQLNVNLLWTCALEAPSVQRVVRRAVPVIPQSCVTSCVFSEHQRDNCLMERDKLASFIPDRKKQQQMFAEKLFKGRGRAGCWNAELLRYSAPILCNVLFNALFFIWNALRIVMCLQWLKMGQWFKRRWII